MQIARPVVLAFILLAGACASTPSGKGAWQAAATKPLRGGIAEFEVISYNGEKLRGRVLLGATIDPLVIDGRLIEPGDLELENFRACDSKERLKHIVDDVSAPPPREDQLVTIRPGYWYGGSLNSWPFYEPDTGPGPDCFEAELVVRVVDGRVAARQMIRVVRTDNAPTTKDGSAKGPKTPSSDAGTP